MRKSIRRQFTRQQFISEVLIPARNAVDSMPYAVGTVDYSELWGILDFEENPVQTRYMSHAEYTRQMYRPWQPWTDPAGSGETFIFDDDASDEAVEAWHRAARKFHQLVRIYNYCWKTPLSQWIELS